MKYFQNEKGLSLVEVLASLVILGIVFVSLMAVFPQMTLFNKKTETKLETMNIARQEMAHLQSDLSYSPLQDDDIETSIIANSKSEIVVVTIPDEDPPVQARRINYKKGNYEYEADFYVKPDLEKKHSDHLSLHKVHLKVLNEGQVSSETYGYIEVINR